jgi:ureidoglycolate lyase
MKLLRYGPVGQEKPGILDDAGTIRDLSSVVDDIDGSSLTADGIAKIAAVDITSLPAVAADQRIGPCVGNVGKMICIGLNYSDHAEETGLPIPEQPIIFMKATSCICGPNDDIEIPRGSDKADWEVELGVVIGKKAKYVSVEDAMDHIAGFCVVNDVSERTFQIERGGQWVKGKSHDTFGPIGPYVVTSDEIADPQKLDMYLDVDGNRMQTGNTDKMIFDVKTCISHLSEFMTLHPGDVIATGTPPGVGMGQKPDPVFLKAGQTMELGIAGLGTQKQKTISA